MGRPKGSKNKPKQLGQVGDQIVMLSQAIKSLKKSVEQLGDKMAPITYATDDKVSTEPVEATPLCAHAEALRELRREIGTVCLQVKTLGESVQL